MDEAQPRGYGQQLPRLIDVLGRPDHSHLGTASQPNAWSASSYGDASANNRYPSQKYAQPNPQYQYGQLHLERPPYNPHVYSRPDCHSYHNYPRTHHGASTEPLRSAHAESQNNPISSVAAAETRRSTYDSNISSDRDAATHPLYASHPADDPSEASRGPLPREDAHIKQESDGSARSYNDDVARTPRQQEHSDFGITKAGKPRKRLAQACYNCREKKIRCNPGSGKCSSCEKNQLECRKPADVDPALANSHHHSKRRLSSPEGSPTNAHANGYSGAHTSRTDTSRSSEDNYRGPAGESYSKRPRQLHHEQTQPDRSIYSEQWLNHTQSFHDKLSNPNGDILPTPVDSMAYEWNRDPFHDNPSLTMKLLEIFFRHRDCGPYLTLPQADFVDWVQNCPNKSADDRMMLYSVLAIGSLFTADPDLKGAGKKFFNIARYAADSRFGVFTLQLAQTRISLCLYTFAKGRDVESYEYIGLSLRALSALKYNLESGVTHFASGSSRSEYGLSENQTVECRRRTFWAGYLMGRYTGYCTGNSSAVHDDDIFLRLPCPDEDFQRDVPNLGPFLDNAVMDEDQTVTSNTTPLGFVSLLVMVGSIWGQCTGYAYRAAHISAKSYPAFYDSFYESFQKRLRTWEELLPAHFKYSHENTLQARNQQYLSDYFVLHCVGCVSVIKANRIAFHDLLPPETVKRNIREARRYAKRLLSIVRVLHHAEEDQGDAEDVQVALSQPFPAYCVMAACDVVSRWGHLKTFEETHQQLAAALSVVSRMARYWNTGSIRERMIQSRSRELSATQLSIQPGQEFWHQSKPIENSVFTKDSHDDLIYQTPDQFYRETFTSPYE